MTHSLRNAFSAKSVLGIQSGPGFVGAVRVQHALQGSRVSHAVFREVSREEEPGAALARLLEEEKLEADAVVTSLPSSAAELREIPVALHNPKKLARIIKYQVENVVSIPIEEALVDFVPAGLNGNVLAAAVRKPAVAEHLEGLSRAGLDPDRVTLDDLALFALYRRIQAGEEGREAAALVRLEPDRGGVLIIRNGRLCLFRSLPDGKAGEEALVEALRLDALRHPDSPVAAVRLTGPGALEHDRARDLEERLGLPVEIWRPFGTAKGDSVARDDALQTRLSVPLGLAMATQEPLTARFNLRKEEFTKQSGSPDRRLVLSLFAGLLLLGALFGVHLQQQTGALEVRQERIRAEMRETLLKTFPETPLVIKGQEAAQMAQKIQEQRARFGWLEEITSERTVLDLLATLTATLSGHRDVTIDNISVDAEAVHLDGRASSFQTVDGLKDKLEKEERFGQVRLLSAKSEKDRQAVRFSFVLEEAP